MARNVSITDWAAVGVLDPLRAIRDHGPVIGVLIEVTDLDDDLLSDRVDPIDRSLASGIEGIRDGPADAVGRLDRREIKVVRRAGRPFEEDK